MDDAIECTVRYYANFRRRTHAIKCLDKVIGYVWSDGSWEMLDDEPAHQERARPMSGETPT